MPSWEGFLELVLGQEWCAGAAVFVDGRQVFESGVVEGKGWGRPKLLVTPPTEAIVAFGATVRVVRGVETGVVVAVAERGGGGVVGVEVGVAEVFCVVKNLRRWQGDVVKAMEVLGKGVEKGVGGEAGEM